VTTLLYLPFIIQGIMMAYDESLHKKRGLGAWERLGHPLDTLTVFAPLSLAAISDYTDQGLTVFIILSVFSSVFITKDEFIHTHECNLMENWVHSMLFILHPMIFVSTAILWKYHPNDHFLALQPVFVGVFMIYQIFRWSLTWKEHLK
jgi:hypothetical protein